MVIASLRGERKSSSYQNRALSGTSHIEASDGKTSFAIERHGVSLSNDGGCRVLRGWGIGGRLFSIPQNDDGRGNPPLCKPVRTSGQNQSSRVARVSRPLTPMYPLLFISECKVGVTRITIYDTERQVYTQSTSCSRKMKPEKLRHYHAGIVE